MNKKIFFGFILFSFLSSFWNLNADVVLNTAGDAVNFALQNSKEYIYRRLTVLESMRLSKNSFRDFLPAVGVSFSESDSVSMNTADSRSKSIQLSLTQLLFDGGQRKLTYDMAKISSMYGYQEFEQSIRDFSSQIINDYYAYLKQRELVKIKNDLVIAAQTQLQIIEMESLLGLTLETDYLEYLISFMQIENEWKQSLRELKNLERKFKIVAGIDIHVTLIINDDWFNNTSLIFLEDSLDLLWALIKSGSIELKKQDTSLVFSQKQASLNKRWFLPSISVEGGVSFSGNMYPLTEPKYYIKFLVNFERNKLLPLNYSNNFGFTGAGLYNVNNTVDSKIAPSSTFVIENRLAEITLLQNRVQRANTETALHESVYDMVFAHDDYLLNIELTERVIALQEKRLEFRQHELESGEIKSVDYLEDLIELAQQKTNILDLKLNAAALERSLEISAQIPFGDLSNVCVKK